MQEDVPLFPLNLVLFPGMPLPLHIFEPRYREMIARCTEEERPFAVLLIQEGREVGAAAKPFDVGTMAKIVGVEKLEDGRLNIVTVGTERFRLLRYSAEKRTYLVGDIDILQEKAAGEVIPSELKEEVATLAGRYVALVNMASGHALVARPSGEAWVSDPHESAPRVRPAALMELPPLELGDLNSIGIDEAHYIGCLIDLGNCVRRHLVMAACLVPLNSLPPREEAILIGSMTRIYKLYDSIVFLITKDRLEIVAILVRPLMDTVLNLLFLIEHGTDEDYANFIKSSLAYDRRLLDNIQARREREGRLDQEPWQIEKRMRESIETRFAKAGFAFDEVQWKDRHLAGNAFDRADQLGLQDFYEIGFRTGSYPVHGTWQDIDLYHVDEEDGVVHAHLDYHEARPQPLEEATTLSLLAARAYVERILGDAATPFVDRLREIYDWQDEAEQRHWSALGEFN